MLFNEGNKRLNAFSTYASFATSTTVLPNNFDMEPGPATIIDDEYSDAEESDEDSFSGQCIPIPTDQKKGPFMVSDDVRYSKDGYTESGKVIDIYLDEESYTKT